MVVLSTVKYLSGSKAGLGGQEMKLRPSSYTILNRLCHQGQGQHYIVENLNITILIFMIKLSPVKSLNIKNTQIFIKLTYLVQGPRNFLQGLPLDLGTASREQRWKSGATLTMILLWAESSPFNHAIILFHKICILLILSRHYLSSRCPLGSSWSSTAGASSSTGSPSPSSSSARRQTLEGCRRCSSTVLSEWTQWTIIFFCEKANPGGGAEDAENQKVGVVKNSSTALWGRCKMGSKVANFD